MNATTALRQIAKTADEALAPIYGRMQELKARIAQAEKAANGRYSATTKARYAAEADKLRGELPAIEAEAAPLEAVYRAAGWARFIFVPGGHVHRFTGCPTLRWNTTRMWLPEYSGADEAELVEAAADAACTVCFPTAPVNKPSTVAAVVAERKATEEEAAAKAAAKQAKAAAAIEVPELRKTFKTQRAAENEVGQQIDLVVSRRYMDAADAEHRAHLDAMAADDLAAARTIAAAIAASVEGYDAEDLLARKFAAKVKEYRRYGWNIPADAAL